MIGKLKALGLAFVAIAALGAVAASAAQASELHVGTTPAVITGAQDEPGVQQFTYRVVVNGTEFTSHCKNATFEGTVSAQTVKELTLTATYSECTFAGLAATIKMNGCKYTLTNESNKVTKALTWWLDIVGCTAGKQIEIKNLACTLTFGEQNTLSHIVFTNKQEAGKPKHVTTEATLTNIAVTADAGCPKTGAGTAEFSANTTVKAFKDAGEKQVTLHGHQYNEHLCGEQVALQAT